MNYPKHMSEVSTITVNSGETLTVWLNRRSADPRGAEQVELRSRDDGGLEIFVDTESVSVRTFEDWESMP